MDSTRNYVSSFESNQNNSVQMYPNPTTSTSTSTVPLITTEKGKLARYVRLLNGTKYNHVILSRLVVVDVLGRQVSINKKVYASSGGTGSVVTQYDNIDDTNTGHHSSGSPGDYLEIDLGEEYYIAYVCFYNVHWYYSAFTADGLNVQLLDASRRLTGTKQLTNQSTVPRLDMGTYIGPTGGYYYKELTGVTPILPTASSCQSGQLDTGDGRCYTTCADGGYTLENPSSDTFCLKNCNSNEDKSWDNLRCIPRCLPGYDPNGESQCIQNCANVNFGMGQANGQDPAGNPLEVMAENSLRCRTVPSPNSVMRWEIWSDWRNNYFPIGSWSRSRGFDPNGLVYTGGWVSWWGDKIWWVPTDTDLGETNRFRLDWPDVKEWAQQNERETVRKPLLRKSPSEGGQGLTSFPPDTNPIMGINQYRVTDLLLNGSRRIRRVYEIARGIQNRTVITRQTGPRTIVNKTGGIYATPTNVVATTNISHIKHTNYNVYLPRFINTHLIMVMGMKTTTESNRTQIISRERKYVYNGIPLFEVLDFTDDVPNTQLSTTSNQSVSYILEEVV
jgi:hypothetical protein